MPMSFVTVYTAFSAADAQLVCSRLSASGLNAEVTDEIASMSMEGYSVAAGGIRINVPEEEADAARALVNDLAQPEVLDGAA